MSLTDPFPQLVNTLLGKEGGYTNDPLDNGGETIWGITLFVARAYGYTGAMRNMPRDIAIGIYRERYWTAPRFVEVWNIAPTLGEKLFDIGVNMGQATGAKWLQRSLNSLNNCGADYPDMIVDGSIGNMTLKALSTFVGKRGDLGRAVLFNMVKSMQTVRYVEIAENNNSQERFEYGWQSQRALL